jgi:hypothetical protein
MKKVLKFCKIKSTIKKDTKIVSELPVCVWDHLIGERFPHRHKMTVGVVVMIVGVGMAKIGHILGGALTEYSFETLGFMLHGAGCTPYYEFLQKWSKKLNNNTIE